MPRALNRHCAAQRVSQRSGAKQQEENWLQCGQLVPEREGIGQNAHVWKILKVIHHFYDFLYILRLQYYARVLTKLAFVFGSVARGISSVRAAAVPLP